MTRVQDTDHEHVSTIVGECARISGGVVDQKIGSIVIGRRRHAGGWRPIWSSALDRFGAFHACPIGAFDNGRGFGRGSRSSLFRDRVGLDDRILGHTQCEEQKNGGGDECGRAQTNERRRQYTTWKTWNWPRTEGSMHFTLEESLHKRIDHVERRDLP